MSRPRKRHAEGEVPYAPAIPADEIRPESTPYELHLAMLETVAEALVTALVVGVIVGGAAGTAWGWLEGVTLGVIGAWLGAWWVFRTVPRKARERAEADPSVS